jgi:hypothetical protein
MLIEAIVRRFPALRSLAEATTGVRQTGTLSVAVAQVESEHTEMTRAGRRFAGIFATTAVANVIAIPTTATMFALYNADTNKSYVIDQITFWVASGTPGLGGTILHIVSPITATLPIIGTGSAVASLSNGGLVSKAVLTNGSNTYAVPTPSGTVQWGITPGQQGQVAGVAAATNIGSNFSADVRGRIIVPPGRVLGLSLLAATGSTPAYNAGITWHEIELDLE